MSTKVAAVILVIIIGLSAAGFAYISLQNLSKTRPDTEANRILYVNETGSNDAYTVIQEAINDAKSGETVFVFNGTYYENIVVDKGITLTGENRNSTTINGEEKGHVIQITVFHVTISGFTITKSGRGEFDAGISVESPYATISDNNIVNNRYGLDIFMDGLCKFQISNNNISHNDNGLTISRSGGNNITHNVFNSNTNGSISFHSSSHNNISHNIFSSGYMGIYLVHSSNNTIASNHFSLHEKAGILNSYSPNNKIIGNIFENDGISLHGKELSDFDSHIIPFDNTVNGEPLYYHVNREGVDIDGNQVGQLILVNCSNMVLRNLQINNTNVGMYIAYSTGINISNNFVSSNTWCGIHLFESSNNTLSNNQITHNRDGIKFNGEQRETTIYNNITCNYISFNERGVVFTGQATRYNYIIANNISNNREGLQLWYTRMNQIYHNNFMNNTYHLKLGGNNSWDSGYPSGGNYWDDYSGKDEFSGQNQDTQGSDGIGDTPYVIGLSLLDNYPLIFPY